MAGGRGGGKRRGGMWRLRPPEGRKHPGEPGSTSRWGGETAGKSEGRLSRFPLPLACLTVKAPGQAAPLRPRPLPSLDPQGRVPAAPALARGRLAPLPIFGAHTLQGVEGPGLGEPGQHPAREAQACGPSPEPARGQTPALAPRHSVPPARPALRRRGAYLLLIGQLLLQIRHLPSGDRPWRWWQQRPPDFPLAVRSSAPRAPAKGGARRPGRRARAPELRLPDPSHCEHAWELRLLGLCRRARAPGAPPPPPRSPA